MYNLEKFELQKQIESLKKQVVDQKIVFNERLQNEKKLKVSNEEQASECREDLLKVKNKAKTSYILKLKP